MTALTYNKFARPAYAVTEADLLEIKIIFKNNIIENPSMFKYNTSQSVMHNISSHAIEHKETFEYQISEGSKLVLHNRHRCNVYVGRVTAYILSKEQMPQSITNLRVLKTMCLAMQEAQRTIKEKRVKKK